MTTENTTTTTTSAAAAPPPPAATILGEPAAKPDASKTVAPDTTATKQDETKADANKTDTKAKEGEAKPDAAKDAAPTDLQLKLPDGVQADAALLDGFKATAKELGLDSAKAQKVLDLYVKAQTDAQQKWIAEVEGWRQQVKADPEVGGQNFEASNAKARRWIAKYGSPEMAEVFNSTGAGNHLSVFRAISRAGGDLAEDSVAGATGGGGKKLSAEEEKLRLSYPSMFPKE